jgi:glucose-1-phosphate adenylyltransferase
MILAGGEGKRLAPLTQSRAKPAVPFGGRYRLIDFVLSNFVNSGIFKINVLTQYKAGSLIHHLTRGWQLAPHMGHYVATVPATQNVGRDWYRGSADAVFQNLPLLFAEHPRDICVFGADHIYKMDVRQMLRFHHARGADATVAVLPIPARDTSDFGIVNCDSAQRITAFVEKPPADPHATGTRLASMGLYIFRTDILAAAVSRDAVCPDSTHDFGHDILPTLVAEGAHVAAYDFTDNRVPGATDTEHGYWRDVGTIDAYWRASADLVSVTPAFDLYNPEWPVFSAYYPSPPAKFVFADQERHRIGLALDSMVSEGCVVSGGRVERSILAPRVRVNSYASVTESILFDDVTIGRNAQLHRVIVDKGVVVPPGARIGFDPVEDRRRFTVSDGGVTVIARGAQFAPSPPAPAAEPPVDPPPAPKPA